MGSSQPAIQAQERRRSDRQPYVVEAFIVSPTATNPYERREVASINVSKHGVAFDFVEPLPRRSYYKIEIGLGDQKLVSEIKIVACRAIEEGLYQIGAEFC